MNTALLPIICITNNHQFYYDDGMVVVDWWWWTGGGGDGGVALYPGAQRGRAEGERKKSTCMVSTACACAKCLFILP